MLRCDSAGLGLRIANALEDLKAHDGSVPANVVEILPQAEVASPSALTVSEVGESVLDGDALSLLGTSLFDTATRRKRSTTSANARRPGPVTPRHPG